MEQICGLLSLATKKQILKIFKSKVRFYKHNFKGKTMSININAAWEQRSGRSICRWFVAWSEISDDCFAGSVAGFSGGGTFQKEFFLARHNGSDLTSLLIDIEDKVSGEEIYFDDDVSDEIKAICNDCDDIIMGWMDEDSWYDYDQLILSDGKDADLNQKDDMLYLGSDKPLHVDFILESLGVTAAPRDSS
jgi:hypothetical protein